MILILSLALGLNAPAHATLKWNSCTVGLLGIGKNPRERILNDLVRTRIGLKFETYASFYEIDWREGTREFYLHRKSPELRVSLIEGEAPGLSQLEIRVTPSLSKLEQFSPSRFVSTVKQLAYLAKYDLGAPLPMLGFEALRMKIHPKRNSFTLAIDAYHPSLIKRHELLVALAEVLIANPASILKQHSERNL